MPFTSDVFDEAKDNLGGAIPVFDLYLPSTKLFWRGLVLLRFNGSLFLFVFYLTTVSIWLWWRSFVWVLRLCFQSKGWPSVLDMPSPGHEIILRAVLLTLSGTSQKTPWRVFWQLYFIFGDVSAFHENYHEAWRQRYAEEARKHIPPQEECSIIIFKDNADKLEIPCRWDMDDKMLIQQIGRFYYLRKAERGIIEALGLKLLSHIEVVKLEQKSVVGTHQYFLKLGRYKSENRLIYLFRNPSLLNGDQIRQSLERDKAFGVPGSQECALNLVSSWNSELAGVIVTIPLALSFLVSVIWAIVAVKVYHADVQGSVQTGFSIGSYIITSGALLIALIAFLDTRYEKVKPD